MCKDVSFVAYLVNGVASVRGSDLDDARSGTVAVCHKCSRASSYRVGGSACISGSCAVDSRTSGAHASLCHVGGDTGVQVSDLCAEYKRRYSFVKYSNWNRKHCFANRICC